MSAPTTLDLAEIKRLLPHRYPFLLVDRILELEIGKRVVGLKNVTLNEPFFPGHFPNNPVMPGVLIIEAMAQVGESWPCCPPRISRKSPPSTSWGWTRCVSANRSSPGIS